MANRRNDLTIILLHGWNQDKRVWFQIENKLSKDFNVFSLDWPGFGNENKPKADWGIPEYSVWLENQIENMHLNNIILIGHSFGGRVVAYTASKNPSWLKAIILSGTPCIYEPNKLVKTRVFLIKIFGKIVPQKIKNLFLSKEDLDAREKGMKVIRYKAITFDQKEFLPKISIPTLIINGKKDIENPIKIVKGMHSLIPNSKLIILENLGHNIFIENENLFYGKVKNFIKNL